MKSFTRFVRENDADSKDTAQTIRQVQAIRNALISLLSSGALDKDIEKDFLMKEEISTFSFENDATRFSKRVRALRSGIASLLTKDGELDDALLKRHGITAMDRKKRGGGR